MVKLVRCFPKNFKFISQVFPQLENTGNIPAPSELFISNKIDPELLVYRSE